MPTTYQLDYEIKPFNSNISFKLYFIPTLMLINKIEKIYELATKQQSITNNLPKVALKDFINELIISEIYATYTIEGVHSSKKEIKLAMQQIAQSSKAKKFRFNIIINNYNKINNTLLHTTCADIRKIFDNIAADEIEESNTLDTLLFRTENSDVTSITGKIIHRGVNANIIEDNIEYILNFVKEDNDIHPTIKIAIAHYLFGYIHPFYDGNGRTSRFMTSLFLNHHYNNITALSLNTPINDSKNHMNKCLIILMISVIKAN